MNFDEFVSRLEGVRRYGEVQASARCPAHNDKSPSLSVKDAGDSILIRCFAGCSPDAIVSAVGLELADLFPEKLEHKAPQKFKSVPADVLRCLGSELTYLTIYTNDLLKGEQPTQQDIERLRVCRHRFEAAKKAVGL